MTYSDQTKAELGMFYQLMSDVRKGIYEGECDISTAPVVYQLGRLTAELTADQAKVIAPKQ